MVSRKTTTFESIQVETLDRDVFGSKSLWQGDTRKLRAVFGGQILAQSMMAACHTVADPDLLLFSAHCYFIGPAQASSPLSYHVERNRDGRIFSTRSVKAVQGGKVVFHCLISFKKPEQDAPALSHASFDMPQGCLAPDDPRMDQESRKKLVFNYFQWPGLASIPLEGYYYFSEDLQKKLLAREPVEPRMQAWVRAHGSISADQPQNTHRAALALLSDFCMPVPICLKYPDLREMSASSLDHSIWFHAPVQGDEWHLQVNTCQQAGAGTSLNTCKIYSGDGTLVATCQQQGLFRSNSKL